MIYLKSITLKQARNNLPKGYNVTNLTHINLLVGDQGCGKSTLLKLLADNSEKVSIDLSANALERG